MAASNGEARVLLTAHHIVKALGTTDTMTDDMIQILSKFDHRFSSMNDKKLDRKVKSTSPQESDIEPDYHPPPQSSRLSSTVSRNSSQARANQFALDAAETVVEQWDMGCTEQASQRWIFECPHEEAETYFDAVDEALTLLESLRSSNRDPGSLDRAQNILQRAMTRLEDELRHMLERYSEPVDPDWLLDSLLAGSFKDPLDEVVDPESDSSEEDDADGEDVPVARPVEEYQTTVDLLPPEVAQDVCDIVQRLIAGGYKRECCQVYVSLRKAVLEESLYSLGVERLTIDEVQRMPWENQEDRIKKWNQAMKVGVKVLFASEKQLCEMVHPTPVLIFTWTLLSAIHVFRSL